MRTPRHEDYLVAIRDIRKRLEDAGTEDVLRITAPISLYIAELTHEVATIRHGVISHWSQWHDGRHRLFSLAGGMIGCVTRTGNSSFSAMWVTSRNDTSKCEHEDVFGTLDDAKLLVEQKLGLKESQP